VEKTVKQIECKEKMSQLESLLRKYFWKAVVAIVLMGGGAFGFYYNQQEKKINRIAIASIKEDERLEKRIAAQESRQMQVEKNQAAMTAQINTHMKWLMDTCNRIETKQTRIEARLQKTP
jgi:hypothetical protein